MGTVVAFERPCGRGRQPAEVEALRDARDELTALVDEGRELAAVLIVVARRAQVTLARGHSPATDLDALERLALRHQARLTAAAAELRADAVCPDGETGRRIGHGAAA
jgi:hypothetical protein